MRTISLDALRGCAHYLRCRHPEDRPHTDFIAFGMATEYLRAVVGNEWTNQLIFTEHPTVSAPLRRGRVFLKTDEQDIELQYRNQERALNVAELLYNLQDVEGIGGLVEKLRVGQIEDVYAELEGGAFLLRRGVRFKYVEPAGVKGKDYDAEIPLPDGTKVNYEIKCKVENAALSREAVRTRLEDARKQLPRGEPGIVFLKVPEAWTKQPDVAAHVTPAIISFLRKTTRIVAVVFRWEELHLQAYGGAVIVYKYRLERGDPPQEVPPLVGALLDILDAPAMAAWVSFRDLAEEAISGAPTM